MRVLLEGVHAEGASQQPRDDPYGRVAAQVRVLR